MLKPLFSFWLVVLVLSDLIFLRVIDDIIPLIVLPQNYFDLSCTEWLFQFSLFLQPTPNPKILELKYL